MVSGSLALLSGPDPHVAGPKAHARCGAPSTSPLSSIYPLVISLSLPSPFLPHPISSIASYLFSFFIFLFFQFSLFFVCPFFLFLLSTSIEHKVPRGPAGPPEVRGPRHVPFLPLWGSGTACSTFSLVSWGEAGQRPR